MRTTNLNSHLNAHLNHLNQLQRSFIGFDQLASCMANATNATIATKQQGQQRVQKRAQQKQPANPPYNVESVAEDKYRVTIAVAGFTEDELQIESQQNQLVVTGIKAQAKAPEQTAEQDTGQKKYLYQGISESNFERKFQLDDFVKVVDASIENGLLQIDLVRELPEAMKPRKIAINSKGQLLDS